MNDLKINIDIQIKLRDIDNADWSVSNPIFNYNINNHRGNTEIATYIDHDGDSLFGATYFSDTKTLIDAQPLITKTDKEKLLYILAANTIDKKNIIYMLSPYILPEKLKEFENTVKKGNTPDTGLTDIYRYSKHDNIDYISHNQFIKLTDSVKYLYIPKQKHKPESQKKELLFLLSFIKKYPKLGVAYIKININDKDDNTKIDVNASFYDKNQATIFTNVNCYKYDIFNARRISPNRISDIFSDIPLDVMQNIYDNNIVDKMEETSIPTYVYKLTDATKEKQKKLLENAKEITSETGINPLSKDDIAYLNMKETVKIDTKKDIEGYEHHDTMFEITPEVYNLLWNTDSKILKEGYVPTNECITVLKAIMEKIL